MPRSEDLTCFGPESTKRSRRSLKVYSRKDSRTPNNSAHLPAHTSSPVKLPSEADITLSEMSRRMLKRSRRSFVEPETEDVAEEENADSAQRRSLKKRKTETLLRSTLPDGGYDQDMDISSTLGGPMEFQVFTDTQKDSAIHPGSRSPPAAPTSPTPRYKGTRIFIPTTSRKSKENASLASPFPERQSTSKQVSSAQTPKPPALQTKRPSRTLSAAQNRPKSTTSSSNETALHRRPSGPAPQHRSPSSDWLAPAKSDLRTHAPLRESIVQSPLSFLAGSPQAFSTPFPNPRPPLIDLTVNPNVTPRLVSHELNTIDNDDVPMSEASVIHNSVLTMHRLLATPPQKTVDITDATSSAPASPDKAHTPTLPRRHTQIHLSEDSIFSSPLDYSATVTIRQPLKLLIPPGVTVSPPRPASSTNFMPDPVPMVEEPHQLTPQRSFEDDIHIRTPASSPVAPGTPSSEGDELRDLFSVLGLDEDEKWDSWRAKSANINRSTSFGSTGKKSSGRKGGRAAAKRLSRSASSDSPVAMLINNRTSTQLQHDPANTSYARELGPRYVPGEPWPTIQRRIDGNPLLSTGEDELLLTRHGWDWEPPL